MEPASSKNESKEDPQMLEELLQWPNVRRMLRTLCDLQDACPGSSHESEGSSSKVNAAFLDRASPEAMEVLRYLGRCLGVPQSQQRTSAFQTWMQKNQDWVRGRRFLGIPDVCLPQPNPPYIDYNQELATTNPALYDMYCNDLLRLLSYGSMLTTDPDPYLDLYRWTDPATASTWYPSRLKWGSQQSSQDRHGSPPGPGGKGQGQPQGQRRQKNKGKLTARATAVGGGAGAGSGSVGSREHPASTKTGIFSAATPGSSSVQSAHVLGTPERTDLAAAVNSSDGDDDDRADSGSTDFDQGPESAVARAAGEASTSAPATASAASASGSNQSRPASLLLHVRRQYARMFVRVGPSQRMGRSRAHAAGLSIAGAGLDMQGQQQAAPSPAAAAQQQGASPAAAGTSTGSVAPTVAPTVGPSASSGVAGPPLATGTAATMGTAAGSAGALPDSVPSTEAAGGNTAAPPVSLDPASKLAASKPWTPPALPEPSPPPAPPFGSSGPEAAARLCRDVPGFGPISERLFLTAPSDSARLRALPHSGMTIDWRSRLPAVLQVAHPAMPWFSASRGSGLVLAGGAALSLTVPGAPATDLDLFLVVPSLDPLTRTRRCPEERQAAAWMLIRDTLETLRRQVAVYDRALKVYVTAGRSLHTLDVLVLDTELSEDTEGRNVVAQLQMVLRLYESPAQVVHGFDVDVCAVLYDGVDVWAAGRALRALHCGFLLLEPVRQSPSYEVRLHKYSRRLGLDILIPGLDPLLLEPAVRELDAMQSALDTQLKNRPLTSWFSAYFHGRVRVPSVRRFAAQQTGLARLLLVQRLAALGVTAEEAKLVTTGYKVPGGSSVTSAVVRALAYKFNTTFNPGPFLSCTCIHLDQSVGGEETWVTLKDFVKFQVDGVHVQTGRETLFSGSFTHTPFNDWYRCCLNKLEERLLRGEVDWEARARDRIITERDWALQLSAADMERQLEAKVALYGALLAAIRAGRPAGGAGRAGGSAAGGQLQPQQVMLLQLQSLRQQLQYLVQMQQLREGAGRTRQGPAEGQGPTVGAQVAEMARILAAGDLEVALSEAEAAVGTETQVPAQGSQPGAEAEEGSAAAAGAARASSLLAEMLGYRVTAATGGSAAASAARPPAVPASSGALQPQLPWVGVDLALEAILKALAGSVPGAPGLPSALPFNAAKGELLYMGRRYCLVEPDGMPTLGAQEVPAKQERREGAGAAGVWPQDPRAGAASSEAAATAGAQAHAVAGAPTGGMASASNSSSATVSGPEASYVAVTPTRGSVSCAGVASRGGGDAAAGGSRASGSGRGSKHRSAVSPPSAPGRNRMAADNSPQATPSGRRGQVTGWELARAVWGAARSWLADAVAPGGQAVGGAAAETSAADVRAAARKDAAAQLRGAVWRYALLGAVLVQAWLGMVLAWRLGGYGGMW